MIEAPFSSTYSLSRADQLVDTAGFDLLGDRLGTDVEDAVNAALTAGAVFPIGDNPLQIFRNAIKDSICDIEADKRGRGLLLQRFLRDGPYERDGEIPTELHGKRLTTEETAKAITFIYAFMVNSFKGAVTELLASGACQRLLERLRRRGRVPKDTRLFVGDAVLVSRKSGKGYLKGADLHFLAVDNRGCVDQKLCVLGVAEVKSGRRPRSAMGRQLEQHIQRATQGLGIAGQEIPGRQVRLGRGSKKQLLRITVQPSDWPIPRTLRFEPFDKGRQLVLDPPVPPDEDDQRTLIGEDRWHISLRWSKEAIAAAAYEMTFWYMEKVGEVIYTARAGLPDPIPKDWEGMTPAAAGRNAVKMMLYYAIRPYALKEGDETISKEEARVMQKAIALYNTYCFGYALGMNFKDENGRRRMLWPEDLDEIAVKGSSREGAC